MDEDGEEGGVGGMGGKQENYKRNFVEQIQLDKVDSFTLAHKSKLLQIQTHLVFIQPPIKTYVCWTLKFCWTKLGSKWKYSTGIILNLEYYKYIFMNFK